MKSYLLFFALIFGLAFSNHQKTFAESKVSKTKVSSQKSPKWSLRYLAKASNSLLVMNDQLLNNDKPLCKVTKKQLQRSQQKLKSIIDEKISSLTEDQVRDIVSSAETCEKTCACDIFSYYFEKSQELQHKSYSVLSEHKAKNTEFKDRLTCARQFREFCQSDLLKTLID
jgi:hypothetical protein